MQLVTAMFCTSFASCCTGSYWYQSNHHGATLASYSNYGHIYLSIYFYNPYLRQRWNSALGKSILHDSIMLLGSTRIGQSYKAKEDEGQTDRGAGRIVLLLSSISALHISDMIIATSKSIDICLSL